MAKCLICRHEHPPSGRQDAISCGVCKTCGMVLCGRRLTVKSAGKVCAFCCARCMGTYKRISSTMRNRLRRGEISEKEFRDFENGVVI